MGKGFVWGRVLQTHVIGDHEIIEFKPFVIRDSQMTRETDDRILFSAGFGKSATRHYNTLDAALLGSLVAKYDGPDTRADRLIAKMLGVPLDADGLL